jgi:hypothetical protein
LAFRTRSLVQGVAGARTPLAANLTGFGQREPVPIAVPQGGGRGSVGDILLASTLAVAINPWGNFAIVKLLRQ